MKVYKIIWKNAINIDGVRKEVGDTFQSKKLTREIRALILNKYIEEVKCS